MSGLVPSLFGLNNSNRDFSREETWGKNQFNSSFPAALCNYLQHKGLNANYLIIEDDQHKVSEISIPEVYGASASDNELFFAFESQHTPYATKIIGSLPRTDLVLQKNGICLRGLEVKLTALPDNTTHTLSEENYGCELVVRPDTIVYLAASIAMHFNTETKQEIEKLKIEDWSDPQEVLSFIDIIIGRLKKIVSNLAEKQTPFLLQPIWKTKGKKAELADYCLDVFVWSDMAFTSFITYIADSNTAARSITRQTRTAIWLYKMLEEIAHDGKCHAEVIIDRLAYNNKNDKAFASSGRITNLYMRCDNLTTPRIHKSEIKRIILGGGQNLLSPERRFDAIIVNSPNLFNEA
jgi:type II restriction enzyme